MNNKSKMDEKIKVEKFAKLLFTDMDNTLLGNDESLSRLTKAIKKSKTKIGVGIASGRNIHSIQERLNETDFLTPDIIISSVGSEIFIKSDSEQQFVELIDWNKEIADGWDRDEIVSSLENIDDMELQGEADQMEFKISYHINENTDLKKVKSQLNKLKQETKLIASKNKDLDILPKKSGKGKAIEFLLRRFAISGDEIVVAGDSGNDEDMLTIGTPAVVVANHSEELNKLEGNEKIFFAEKEYAAGILEGLQHFKFFENTK